MMRLLLALAASLPLMAEEFPSSDLLRLTNGELEGQFGGLDANGVLSWVREDGIAPMEFKTDKVRQIVLRGGQAVDPGKDAAHLELINGDRLPGRILSLDDEHFTIDTPMAGELVIPRDAVVRAAPKPFGGRLIYAGPFSADKWEVFTPADSLPAPEPEEPDPEEPDPEEPDPEEPDPEEPETEDTEDEDQPSWKHQGSKWYFIKGRDALRSRMGLPDQAMVRFELEWRSRPPIAIAFHADFKVPEFPEPDEDEELTDEQLEERRKEWENRRRNSHHLADYFGNAYVLTLRSSYAQLQHCGFNDEGNPFINQVRSSSNNIRFDDTGKAVFELRCNRKKGVIALYVNGEFSMQWDVEPAAKENEEDEDVYGGLGDGLGFQLLGTDTPVRISDIVVAEWNGMPDSARSLQSDEFDVVLLTNGTDRFSGKVESIRDGKLTLQGRYAPLEIPLEEIAEVQLAGDRQRTLEDTRDRLARIHFQPIGRLSGIAGLTTEKQMELRSPLIQNLSVDLTSAVIIEFQSGSSFLNYWDDEL